MDRSSYVRILIERAVASPKSARLAEILGPGRDSIESQHSCEEEIEQFLDAQVRESRRGRGDDRSVK